MGFGNLLLEQINEKGYDRIDEYTRIIVQCSQKAITIKKALPQNNLPVFADKPMISTVLRNLISNAIKFTHQGGEIRISAQQNNNEILVSVSDNGVGISPARVEKLFRIDRSDTTHGTNNESGTGLGLILCKEFIEKHGGRLWVDSEEGKGSTFYFSLNSGHHLI